MDFRKLLPEFQCTDLFGGFMILPMLFELPLIVSTSPRNHKCILFKNPCTLNRIPAFFKYSQLSYTGRSYVRFRVWVGKVKKQPLTSSRGVAHSHKELNSSAFGGNCWIFVLETRSMHCVKWRKEGCACLCVLRSVSRFNPFDPC